MEENYTTDQNPKIGISRGVARKQLKISKIASYPILLKRVAQSIPDLFIDGQELDDGISGMQATYKGKSFIRYNSNHNVKRSRFTVAHELGHALLGHVLECTRGDFKSRDAQEVEANQFAAELLMPLELLKVGIKKSKTVSDLARDFWVSKDAMSWRVLQTGLYDKLESWN